MTGIEGSQRRHWGFSPGQFLILAGISKHHHFTPCGFPFFLLIEIPERPDPGQNRIISAPAKYPIPAGYWRAYEAKGISSKNKEMNAIISLILFLARVTYLAARRSAKICYHSDSNAWNLVIQSAHRPHTHVYTPKESKVKV